MTHKEFKELGFKRHYLPDKSGFWYTKKVGKYFKYYVDEDFNHYELVFMNEYETTIKFKSLKQLLKSMSQFKFKI